jgi:hypothetical protein
MQHSALSPAAKNLLTVARESWICMRGFQFAPGMSGGDVAGGGCGEPGWVRGDPDAADVETVGVKTDREGGLGLEWGTVVDLARGNEELHAGIIEVEVPGFAELQGQLRAAASMGLLVARIASR